MAVLSNFSIQQQAQTEWCWAAVSVSVFLFFNDQRWPDQCKLVNDIFSAVLLGDCCQDGTTDECNLGWDIQQVLYAKGHLAGQDSSPVGFDILTREVAVNKAPVVVRVEFDDGLTDHFIAIVGCDSDSSGAQFVLVADPGGANGNTSSYPFDNFPDNYRAGATWTNTYRTKAAV